MVFGIKLVTALLFIDLAVEGKPEPGLEKACVLSSISFVLFTYLVGYVK